MSSYSIITHTKCNKCNKDSRQGPPLTGAKQTGHLASQWLNRNSPGITMSWAPTGGFGCRLDFTLTIIIILKIIIIAITTIGAVCHFGKYIVLTKFLFEILGR